jgi:hypothetical protein
MGTFSWGGLIVSFILGYGITGFSFYISARRHKKEFAVLRGSEIGVIVTAILMVLGELSNSLGPTGAQGVGGIFLIIAFPICVLLISPAIPVAILTTESSRKWVRVAGVIGVLVISSVIIYAASFAWMSWVFPGPTIETGQYTTEKWNTYTDTAKHFTIEYPPELQVSKENTLAAYSVVDFTVLFSTSTEYGEYNEGSQITLNINNNPTGVDRLDFSPSPCGLLPCAPYQPAQSTTLGGYPASINFLTPTSSTSHFISTTLRGAKEAVNLNALFPYNTDAADASMTQGIYMKMLSTFQFTAPFTPGGS